MTPDHTTIAIPLDELNCAICLDVFDLPVTLRCGHTFCRYCIVNKHTQPKCPLCRSFFPTIGAINLTLLSLASHVRNDRAIEPAIPAIPASPPELLTNSLWFADQFSKPHVALPLLIRTVLQTLTNTVPIVMYNDMVICAYDFMDSGDLWSKSRWIMSARDCEVFTRHVGLIHRSKRKNFHAFQTYVKTQLLAKPWLCKLDNDIPRLSIRVTQQTLDEKHRMQIFDSCENMQGISLPWDLGRHENSVMYIPHPSISHNHLLFFIDQTSGYLNVLDCGSTLGSAIRIEQKAIQEGDMFFIGNDICILANIFDVTAQRNPFHSLYWSRSLGRVVDLCFPNETTDVAPISTFVELNIQYRNGSGQFKKWISPSGTLLGRHDFGSSQWNENKIIINSDSVAVNHLIIYYNGNKPKGEEWIIKSLADAIGTYHQLEPFFHPFPIIKQAAIMAGQCRILVVSDKTRAPASSSRNNIIWGSQQLNRQFIRRGLMNIPPSISDEGTADPSFEDSETSISTGNRTRQLVHSQQLMPYIPPVLTSSGYQNLHAGSIPYQTDYPHRSQQPVYPQRAIIRSQPTHPPTYPFDGYR